jgi:hypothetical protein
MNTNQKRIKHEEDYINFLEKRLGSMNFKRNSSPEEIEKTEAKLKKAKLVLRVLKK